MIDKIKTSICRLNELFGEDYVKRLNLLPYLTTNRYGYKIKMLKIRDSDIRINIEKTGHIEGKFDRIDLIVYSDGEFSESTDYDILDKENFGVSETACFRRNPSTQWNHSSNIKIFEDLITKLALKKAFPEFYKFKKDYDRQGNH